MFDVKKLPPRPEIARKLLHYSRLNGLAVAQEVIELASQGMVSQNDLQGFPVALKPEEMECVQYVRDWNNRGIILDGPITRASHVALAAAFMLDAFPLVILTRMENFITWATLVSQVWPDRKINIFGYKLKKGEILPRNVTASSSMDEQSDIFISSSYYFAREGFIERLTPGMFITDEFVSGRTFNHTNASYVNTFLNEVQPMIVIQNVASLWEETIDMESLLNVLCMGHTKNHLNELICNLVWPNAIAAKLYGHNIYDALRHQPGFTFDSGAFLGLFGIATHLVSRPSTDSLVKIRFQNTSVERLKAISNNVLKSNLRDHLNEEKAIVKLSGKPLHEIISNIIEGRTNRSQIRKLHTQGYCEFKAQEIKRQFSNCFFSFDKRFYIVADNPRFQGVLASTMYTGMVIPREDSQEIVSRYTKRRNDEDGEVIYNMIGNISSLGNPDILRATNYIVLAQPPTDHKEYQVLLEYCREFKIVLVDFLFRGSYEEMVLNYLDSQ